MDPKRIAGSLAVALALAPAVSQPRSSRPVPGQVTFTKDIAPILQRSCQNCHRPDGSRRCRSHLRGARPWARSMKQRTGIGRKAGVMPPWYIEKNIGIQHYKDDPSLSDEEVAKIAKWADTGAPRGNPEDMPAGEDLRGRRDWRIGEPDLDRREPGDHREGQRAGLVGRDSERRRSRLTEDRYVASVEIKRSQRLRQAPATGRADGRRPLRVPSPDLGARAVIDGGDRDRCVGDRGAVGWPVHEVGRNADIFDRTPARLLKADSSIVSESAHLHSGGRDMKSKLQFGFRFHPMGYKPALPRRLRSLGNALDIDIKPNEANQQLHAYEVLPQPPKVVTFEPHLHAPGQRMCLEAIWGYQHPDADLRRLRPQLGARVRVRGRLRADPAARHHPAHHRLHGQHAEQQEHSRSAQLAGIGQPIDREHVHRPRRCMPLTDEEFRGRDGEAPREAAADAERCDCRLPVVLRGRTRAADSQRLAGAQQP